MGLFRRRHNHLWLETDVEVVLRDRFNRQRRTDLVFVRLCKTCDKYDFVVLYGVEREAIVEEDEPVIQDPKPAWLEEYDNLW